MSARLWLSGMRALLLGVSLYVGGIGRSAASTPSPRGPSGCPPGVSPEEFVCFTIKEEARRQEKILDLEAVIVQTRLDLAQSRAKRLKRFGMNFDAVCGVNLEGRPDCVLGVGVGFRF